VASPPRPARTPTQHWRNGAGICDKVAHGRSYADLVGDVQADFVTSDYYQGAYQID
jgi:hypothetical protein